MEVRQTLGGRYTLLDELGSGGMAVVWRARDEVLGRPVAVKVLAGRYADDPHSRARIRDEARSAANLSHPNIAQVYDYGEATTSGDPRPYVVMELINGPTLQQRVSAGPLPPRTVFRICGEVAAALAAAHADGLVHRDIKMANVMVTPGGAKVVDFGIAAAAGPASPEDILVGTPAYLAPERLTGDQVVPASDVYALGVLLYRLLADESPWSVESTTQMLQAHVYAEPARLPELPGVPPSVADLVDRCLRKDPRSRPSAAEVSSILGDAAEAAQTPDPVRREAVVPPPRAPMSATGRAGVLEGAALAARSHPGASEAGPTDRAAATEWAGAVMGAGSADRAGAVGVAGVAGNQLLAGVRAEVLQSSGPAYSARDGARRVPPRMRNRRPAGGWRGVFLGADPRGRVWRIALIGTVLGLIVVGFAGWALNGKSSAEEPAADGRATATAEPAVSGGSLAQLPPPVAGGVAPTGPAGPVAGPTDAAGQQPPAAGSTPARSAAPSGSAAVSSRPSRGAVPPTSSAGSSAVPAGTRLTSPGGVVFAACGEGKATLSSWQPANGYAVEKVQPGPSLTTVIVFRSTPARYRMTVTCVAGTPTPVVLPL